MNFLQGNGCVLSIDLPCALQKLWIINLGNKSTSKLKVSKTWHIYVKVIILENKRTTKLKVSKPWHTYVKVVHLPRKFYFQTIKMKN